MGQNRNCQIYRQILHPEKNVMGSTVLQVRGHKSPLLLGGKLWHCGAVRTGQCTAKEDAVPTADRSCWCGADSRHKLSVRTISNR